MTCSITDCGRRVWFTAEQLCRRHGLDAGLHIVIDPDDDPDLWTVPTEPAPAPARGGRRKPKRPVPATPDSPGITSDTHEGDPNVS